MQSLKQQTKRILVGVAGAVIVLLGVVMIPYPGPGWLVVFAGLALLATEFAWAHHILMRLRGYYDRWVVWLKAAPLGVRITVALCTFCVVIATIWLVNGYGIIDNWLGLQLDWTHSPLSR